MIKYVKLISGENMSFWQEFKEDFDKQAKLKMEKSEQRRKEKKLEKQERKDKIKEMKKEGIAHCPRCKSTSIQYVERRKRLSIGRGIVGTVVAGPLAGAVGAVTSKKYKGFVKCLNCGHEWKI